MNAIDPDKTPDFLMEIILTHITEQYENYRDFVSHSVHCCRSYVINCNVTGCRKFHCVTAYFEETYSL